MFALFCFKKSFNIFLLFDVVRFLHLLIKKFPDLNNLISLTLCLFQNKELI
ncbi:hypothetical protein CHCC15075_1911 [Bacillus licheniformis]|uniref:Uncharacterized protein n=1 Tax=Bacillus licheniformis TaxID=1402 RepID=A0A8B5Y844_BACLI|nr:hypothetical protein B4091_3009 [Bacillus licheniformis]KYC96417.1 hypothetical protein B4164_2862 [Bacillus licheniformis]TWK52871.1 hypothetical protein CHCC20345_2872 [Bacillus licheniformis]TWL23710.1 hypothetical protein CHCC16736_1418 [Bacillus licheniformis]TWL24738.1 hypothetical protein CHCC15546_2666 [Bacillus licheniformis]